MCYGPPDKTQYHCLYRDRRCRWGSQPHVKSVVTYRVPKKKMSIMKKIHKMFKLRYKAYRNDDLLPEAQKLREELIELRKQGKFNKMEEYVFKKMNIEYYWRDNSLGMMFRWERAGAYHHDIFVTKDVRFKVLCLCGYCQRVWELLGNIFYISFFRDITDDLNDLVENFDINLFQKKLVEKLIFYQNLDPEISDIDYYKKKDLGCFHLFPVRSLAHRMEQSYMKYAALKEQNVEDDDSRIELIQIGCNCCICSYTIVI